MTAPNREQVVQWADECGLTKGQHWNRKNMTTAFMTDFATLARADIEATIAEQEAEIERLKAELEGEKAAVMNYRADAIEAEKQRDDANARAAEMEQRYDQLTLDLKRDELLAEARPKVN